MFVVMVVVIWVTGIRKTRRESAELRRNRLLPESGFRKFHLTDKTAFAWTSHWSKEWNPERFHVGNWSLQKLLASSLMVMGLAVLIFCPATRNWHHCTERNADLPGRETLHELISMIKRNRLRNCYTSVRENLK